MSFIIATPTLEQIAAMPRQDYRVLENKVRRALQRQGYQLARSRARDPRAPDYGHYTILDPVLGAVDTDKPMTTLIEVIEWLNAGVPKELLTPAKPRITNGMAQMLGLIEALAIQLGNTEVLDKIQKMLN